MKPQAVRRPARYLRLRTWWRGVDVATHADAVFGAVVLAAWLVVSMLAPLLLAPGASS